MNSLHVFHLLPLIPVETDFWQWLKIVCSVPEIQMACIMISTEYLINWLYWIFYSTIHIHHKLKDPMNFCTANPLIYSLTVLNFYALRMACNICHVLIKSDTVCNSVSCRWSHYIMTSMLSWTAVKNPVDLSTQTKHNLSDLFVIVITQGTSRSNLKW